MRTSVRQWCRTLLASCRYWILPSVGPACFSEPTCSEYARAAISRYGVLGGRKLAIFRLMKCYPFHPG